MANPVEDRGCLTYTITGKFDPRKILGNLFGWFYNREDGKTVEHLVIHGNYDDSGLEELRQEVLSRVEEYGELISFKWMVWTPAWCSSMSLDEDDIHIIERLIRGNHIRSLEFGWPSGIRLKHVRQILDAIKDSHTIAIVSFSQFTPKLDDELRGHLIRCIRGHVSLRSLWFLERPEDRNLVNSLIEANQSPIAEIFTLLMVACVNEIGFLKLGHRDIIRLLREWI